jgi:Domain of unknown function (DUF6532)
VQSTSPQCLAYWRRQITSRASEVRGKLKTIARGFAAGVYGLNKSNEDEHNREAIKTLLTKSNFLYQVRLALLVFGHMHSFITCTPQAIRKTSYLLTLINGAYFA